MRLLDMDAWDIEMPKVPKSMSCFCFRAMPDIHGHSLLEVAVLAISASKNSSMIQWGE